MRWNRVVGWAGAVALAASAFLPWFRCAPGLLCFGTAGPSRYTASDIPALVLLRYADRATSLRLGHIAVLLGILAAAAALLRPPLQGVLLLAVGVLGLTGAATFVALLAREANDVGGASLGDLLGLGPVAAGVGAALIVTAGAGSLSRPAPLVVMEGVATEPVALPAAEPGPEPEVTQYVPVVPPRPEPTQEWQVEEQEDWVALPPPPPPAPAPLPAPVEEQPTCPSCGKPTEKGRYFCFSCGHRLR